MRYGAVFLDIGNMSYIGMGANRLSEIAARCNEPVTNLSRPLKNL